MIQNCRIVIYPDHVRVMALDGRLYSNLSGCVLEKVGDGPYGFSFGPNPEHGLVRVYTPPPPKFSLWAWIKRLLRGW